MPSTDRIDQLRAKREGYRDEAVFHKFLIDAYLGTGGFAGKVKPPTYGYLGRAAEVYSSDTLNKGLVQVDQDGAEVTSYLDRFHREDEAKYAARQDVAYYLNYVAPIQDLLLSYVEKNPISRSEEAKARLEKWLQDCDGLGTSWEVMRHEVIDPRAALLGYCPVLIDAPAAPPGLTRGQAQKLQIRPKALPLFPSNLLDWQVSEEGRVEWIKVVTIERRRASPFEPALTVERYAIWFPERVIVQEVHIDEDGQETLQPPVETRHTFGQVPIVFFRHRPSPQSKIRGVSMVGAVAVIARRLFNCLSELDEHLRGQVFALLQVPVDSIENLPNLIVGVHNAAALLDSAKHEYKYVSPPQSVADTYEARIEALIKEVYRIARVEFTKPTGNAQSGISRAFEFEQTNRGLADFAGQLARGDQETLRLVAKVFGASPGVIESIRSTPPDNFRVEDLAGDLDNVIKAVSLTLGPTAEMILVLRLLERMLPNLTDEERAAIESELEEFKNRKVQEDAADHEARLAAAAAVGEDDEDNDEGDDEDNLDAA